jgi:DnaJ domain
MPKKDYKPRLGFDIRVKPPTRGGKPPAWSKPEDRDCEWKDCDNQAACSLPKSPREPRKLVWYCLAHAREHNKSWNYFDGLSDAEAKAAREANQYGGRPTWSMGKNDRARASLNKTGSADMADAFGVLDKEAASQSKMRGQYRDGKLLTKLQAKAFDTMALPYGATSGNIRKRYAELVRRFHPDANGGDRSAEQQLSEVVKAHTIMKKAKFV